MGGFPTTWKHTSLQQPYRINQPLRHNWTKNKLLVYPRKLGVTNVCRIVCLWTTFRLESRFACCSCTSRKLAVAHLHWNDNLVSWKGSVGSGLWCCNVVITSRRTYSAACLLLEWYHLTSLFKRISSFSLQFDESSWNEVSSLDLKFEVQDYNGGERDVHQVDSSRCLAH